MDLSKWIKIDNMGRNNKGIYISNIYPDRLLKIGSDGTLVNELNNKMDSLRVFPLIYNIYKSKNTEITEITEMQRFAGNITELLFEFAPKYIIKKMNIIEQDKKDMYFIFNIMLNKSKKSKISYNLLPIHKYLYEKSHKIESLKYIFLTQKNKDKNFDGFHIFKKTTFRDFISPLENIYELENRLKESKITKILFDSFFSQYNKLFNELIIEITKQITKIKLILKDFGKKYTDNKFDNFVFELSQNKREHLGVNWTKNNFFDQYLYIYVIDWDSGLSNIDTDTNTNIYNYSVYGTNRLDEILNKVLHNFDLKNINSNINKILNTKYKLNFSNINTNF